MQMGRWTIILIAAITLIISIVVGLRIANGNDALFDMLYLGMGVLLFFTLTVLTRIIDRTLKKRLFIYPGLGLVCFVCALITAAIAKNINDTHKQDIAQQIILELETYRDNHGQYPQNLNNITAGHFDNFQYRSDTTGEAFTLWYSPDGWHHKSYTSQTRQWEVSD